MSEPYVGEVRAFGFNFAPYGWAFCNGQLLAINDNAALYSLIGTLYGGNGTTNFAVPNLMGRAPMHWGDGAGMITQIGEMQGAPSVTLITSEMPSHTHTISAAHLIGGTPERTAGPNTNGTSYMSHVAGGGLYGDTSAQVNTPFSNAAISLVGGNQAHENRQPFLTVNFCIALLGIYPSRS